MVAFSSRLGIVLALAIATQGAQAQALTVGDPAPPLKVGRWLKGDAVAKLEPGKVYVIDFFGILCGPCIAAIPHVSSLAKKYAGRATFIGLSLVKWTATQPYPDGSMPHQMEFMKTHAKDMDYHVAADTPDGYMAVHLFGALGLDSVPHAIVIDRQGKIAWVGDVEGLDRAVSKAIAGGKSTR